MEIEAFLKQFRIFADLTPAEFSGIGNIFFQRRFAKGDTLLREGDVSPQLILIESGEVHIYKGVGKAGRTLGTRVAGESLGEFTVFSSDAHTATAVAGSDVSAYVALGAEFLRLATENTPGVSKIAVRMLNVAVERFRKMEEQSVIAAARGLSEPTIEGRLLHAIQYNEPVRVSFYSGSDKDVEGMFRLIDVSSEMGVPLVRLAMELETSTLRGKEIKLREYVIPMSGLHFISFDSSGKS